MRILLDACIGRAVAAELTAGGHDVASVPQGPGISDEAVLAQALREDRILVTADKDFGELVFLRGAPCPGIVRLVRLPLAQQGPVTADAVRRFAGDLRAGAFVVVEEDRVRVRRAARP